MQTLQNMFCVLLLQVKYYLMSCPLMLVCYNDGLNVLFFLSLQAKIKFGPLIKLCRNVPVFTGVFLLCHLFNGVLDQLC